MKKLLVLFAASLLFTGCGNKQDAEPDTMETTRAEAEAMEAEQARLLRSLGGTSLNLKTFIPLVVKYGVSGEFPGLATSGPRGRGDSTVAVMVS